MTQHRAKRRRAFLRKRQFQSQNLSTKKVRSLLQTTHQIYFDWTYVYAGSAPFIFLFLLYHSFRAKSTCIRMLPLKWRYIVKIPQTACKTTTGLDNSAFSNPDEFSFSVYFPVLYKTFPPLRALTYYRADLIQKIREFSACTPTDGVP